MGTMSASLAITARHREVREGAKTAKSQTIHRKNIR
jgi:hypothetical protein